MKKEVYDSQVNKALDMYEKALERIYNIKTDKKYIYSFALEQFILL